MAADAIEWIAIGLPLVICCVGVYATTLCHWALRNGGEVEVEMKAPSLSVRLHVTGTKTRTREIQRGDDSQRGPTL